MKKTEWKSKADYRNPEWKYKNSVSTNVLRTIRRVQREMAALGQTKRRVK